MDSSRQDCAPSVSASRPVPMLALATVGFAICFWAWSLIGPLGPTYAEELGLSSFEQALLVALPVVMGSVGRIPAGALTDRFGARRVFPALAALTIVPVLAVGLAGSSYPVLLAGGFLLGAGGTVFAVGIPLVNGWFPPERRGLALGVFGTGTVGTAMAAFTTVWLSETFGRLAPFALVSAALLAFVVVALAFLQDPPAAERQSTDPHAGSVVAHTWRTLTRPLTLQLSWLYAIAFGGFVAFSVYLPTYLTNAYGLDRGDAALRTAGFIVVAVLARPAGGWLSDRLDPALVLAGCFLAGAGLAALAALELELLPAGTVAFLGLATVLGAGSGATFALAAERVPAERVGAVSGVVGAAGGLGGFVPPLLMGTIYGATGDYGLGLGLLAVISLGTAAFTWLRFRPRPFPGHADREAG